MKRKALIAILVVAIIVASGGAWYYFSRVRHSPIEEILSNPKGYEGKVITIEGEVTDRTSFFGVLKFYKVKDKTGEIMVVTRRSLPAAKAEARVSGRIDEAFPIGDQKLIVFQEGSVEEKGGKENK